MEPKVRFGVRGHDGCTSNVWTCWTQPVKGDVYLTSDAMGKSLKLSDHPTGRSHIAFHFEKREELFTAETLPKERFILKQEGAEHAEELWRLVAVVHFPAQSLSDMPRSASKDTIWLPEAPLGQATEVGIFRFNVQTLPDSWPGKHEGAVHLADLPLLDVGRVCIVWRHAVFEMPPSPKTTGSRGLFKGRSEEDLLEANRAVTFGRTDTGAFSLIETKVVVTRDVRS